MELASLLEGLVPAAEARIGDGLEITGLTIDPSEVQPGWLFVARRSWYGDTHARLDEAITRGAAALVVSRPEATRGDLPCVLTDADDPFLARVSARFYGHPTERLAVYGVTGTNGKTSVTWMLEHLLRQLGERPAVMGTTGYRFEGRQVDASNTTPDALVIQRFAADALELGATALVLEVSSHGLALDRVAEVAFDAVGFTNLSQDHLDFHRSLAAYADAKARLFDDHLRASLEGGKRPLAAICVADADPHGVRMLDLARAHAHTIAVHTGTGSPPMAQASEHWWSEATIDGTALITPGGAAVCRLPLVGAYNVHNAMLAVAMLQGIHPGSAARLWTGLHDFAGVPGRLSRPIRGQGRPAVFVDYAHTADAVERVLAALAEGRPARPLVVLLGCGGDRDPGKRPRMAAAAVEGADLAILTSDNPRAEPPGAILDAMLAGVPPRSGDRVRVLLDRSQAIQMALDEGWGGTVVLCGKGHEPYQIIGERTYHLDDSEEARRAVVARERGLSIAEVPLFCGWSEARWQEACGGSWQRRPERWPLLDPPRLEAPEGWIGEGDRPAAVLTVPSLRAACERLALTLLEEGRERQQGLLRVQIDRPEATTRTRVERRVGAARCLTLDAHTIDGLALQLMTLCPRHRLVLSLLGPEPPAALPGPDLRLDHATDAALETIAAALAGLVGGRASAGARPHIPSLLDPARIKP